MGLEINIFINKIQRVPFPKIQEMLKEHEKDIAELSYINQNAILNFIEKRMNIAQSIPQEEIMFNMVLFTDLSRRRNMNRQLREEAESELKSLDLMALIESLQYIDSDKIEAILRNYHSTLPTKIIETLIINLPENKQIAAITMCKQDLMNSEPNTFHNFMASISKEAQKFVLENFGEKFEQYSTEDISNQIENETESLKVITYGTSESRMSRPDKKFEGTLPRVLENVGYSDAKNEQCILAEVKHNDLYYGEVVARYQDPRPQIREFRDIKSMSDKEIADLNKKLDAIEFTITGKTRDTNVRNCRYIVCSKDWYISIDNDGQVTTQILRKDSRATEECKAKAQLVIEEIKTDKIVVPTDVGSVGGEER